MDGTINTPMGAMKKNTAMLVGGASAIIVGVVYYRSKKQSAAAAAAAAGANTAIDPATGYAYGSAEDAAALANQASYQSPGGGHGGGSSYVGTSPGSFVSNAQWAQYCEQYLTNNSMVTDQVILGTAVGKYLSGQPVTPDMASLVQQCIAIGGLPPVAGPSGYPPSINTSNPVPPINTPPGTTPPVTTGRLPAPKAVSQGTVTRNSGLLFWDAVPGAVYYTIYQGGGTKIADHLLGTANWINGLSPGLQYGYQVTATDASGQESPKSSVAQISTAR